MARLLSGLQACPACTRTFEAIRFNPLPRPPVVTRMADAGPQGASPCGAHPGNAASVGCSRCGVFMCALCTVEIEARALCPPCFERLLGEDALPSARRVFKDYSRSVFTLVVLGLFLWPFMSVLGAGAVYYGVLDIRQKRADGDSGLVRSGIGIAFAVLEIAGGVFILLHLFKH
jgi:hypothetical protein